MVNLAGVRECNHYIYTELSVAGIEVVRVDQSESEVPYSIEGRLCGWKFRRLWYYWSARSTDDSMNIPLKDALNIHNKEVFDDGMNSKKRILGKLIRVDGNCGCPEPKNDIGVYHIDSQTGLNEFALLLKELASRDGYPDKSNY